MRTTPQEVLDACRTLGEWASTQKNAALLEHRDQLLRKVHQLTDELAEQKAITCRVVDQRDAFEQDLERLRSAVKNPYRDVQVEVVESQCDGDLMKVRTIRKTYWLGTTLRVIIR